MPNEVEIIIRAIDKASGVMKNVKGANDDLKASFKAAGIVLGGLTAAVGAAAVAWKTVVSPLIDYNKSMLDASRATRMGVEDLSRFVQVGDDMGVSMDSITRALQGATKNGFAPSISSLADLADRANAMSTSTERAAMLAKIFGRNWAELNPILELGGQGIRDLAAAQADGLVVTEAEIKKSEDLRLKIDQVTDSWTAYRNELALKVIPVIVGYLDKATEQARISGILQRAGVLNIASYAEQSYALTRLALGDDSYVKAIEAEVLAHDNNTAAMMRALGPTEAFRAGIAALGLAAKGAFPKVNAITQEMLDIAMQASNGQQKVDILAAAIASLRDKSITIDITTINREIDIMMNNAPTSWYTQQTSAGSGYGPRVEGAGGKFYRMNNATGLYEPAQIGLDMVVPPGYNENFGVRASSGERVQVTPAGKPNAGGSGVTINVTSSPMDTQYMVKAIKAAVGM
jgi:hypothetical protein